mmetsp:Transcript_3712/g.9446  ORF Transcript_3712/g.9446 Transcript_3712/m.9446 type:complete len:81 (-) Transcript_3712:691-933(-)
MRPVPASTCLCCIFHFAFHRISYPPMINQSTIHLTYMMHALIHWDSCDITSQSSDNNDDDVSLSAKYMNWIFRFVARLVP